MKLTQSLLALCVLMCGVAGADDRCGCNKPKPVVVKPAASAPMKEMPKPAAPQKSAAAEPKAEVQPKA